MPRTVVHKPLNSRNARAKLKHGRQPHLQSIGPNVSLAYRRAEGSREGVWLLRRYLGGGNNYKLVSLGRADDVEAADGSSVLDYAQALPKAQSMAGKPDGDRIERMTVRQAMSLYLEFKKSQGQSVSDVTGRGTVHILPTLGDKIVSELTAQQLRRWLADMAASPAQLRAKDGKPQYRPEPDSEEDIRKRRSTANRVLTILKAVLNHAYDSGHVAQRDAWGRKLKPFPGVDAARVRYLQIAEAQRLLNGCEPDFRPLVRAALETGARYGELCRLDVADFNADAGTVFVQKSKAVKARHIVLTEDCAEFFRTHTAGKSGGAIMFAKDGERWKKDDQKRLMKQANVHAKIEPRVSFHILRHTWASLAVMNGVPLMVVAKNLGHTDTRMVEKHYGHLAPSYVVDAIRAGAPRFGIAADKTVVQIR